ncbi:uncharacterized protein SPSK_04014 [Sporothrix schenckii 1099-18]|uniref:Uncharacterized protein n=1 Tax=Sporothrix schenckii 1099-18 TaxID=1397361 RepID=A0A0F2M3Z8_SPOSC|nr:uncharacterized protein SPSK_04014 [Sporothrix schenckii 1099-18]KJR82891.1 hypothetical protein SPSK_04014 [Sporothrix schenckii 1099-18]
MGLPLYVPPVESDLHNKHAAGRSSPTHGPNRIRRTRRSIESLVQSRRRAILTAVANLPRLESLTDSQRANIRQRQRELDEMQERMERRHEMHLGALPESQRERLNRTREPLVNAYGLSAPPPPRGEHLLQQYLTRDSEQARAASHAREQARVRINGHIADRNSSGSTRRAAISGDSGLREEHRRWYEHVVSRASETPSALLEEGPGSLMTAAIASGLDDSDDAYTGELMAALGSRLARSSAFVQGLDPTSTSQPDGALQQQQPRESVDSAGPDFEARPTNVRARHRLVRSSSLRRVTNASAPARRPTVGWSDSNDRATSRSRESRESRESSQSRIFGDTSQIPNGGGSTPGSNGRATPDAAASRRHAWRVGYLDLNGDRHLPLPETSSRREAPPRSGDYDLTDEDGNPLEDGYGVPVDPVDGFGDRRRSLSPEVNSWETILTTLTADPQLPSVGLSFASSTSALAAATAQDQSTWASSSQPTVTQTPVVPALPAVPSPVTRDQDDNDNGTNGSTPAPVLVEMSRTPSWLAEDHPVLTDSVPSGTTSAGTSQRIRSPFTVVSADAETADESPVLFNGLETDADDAACEDSEMDDGVHRDGDEEGLYDEEEEREAEEARAYLLGLSDERPGRRPGQGGADPMERMLHFASRDRPMRTGFGGARPDNHNANDITTGNTSANISNTNTSTNNGSGSGSNTNDSNNNNNTDETLDTLGIGGMQHIVRSLARREDIPDEWWAEAGLSRTLPREASN